MHIPEIHWIKEHPEAKLPAKVHNDLLTGDTGYDIIAVEDIIIPAKGSAVADAGLKLAFITPGFWFKVEARSGNGFKKHLLPHPGVIDNPYRGGFGIKLYNLSDEDQIIKKGNGLAQIALYKLESAQHSFVDEVTGSERGEKGFGSSDK